MSDSAITEEDEIKSVKEENASCPSWIFPSKDA